MIGTDALDEERIALATPGGTNSRWSNTQLLLLTSRAIKNLVAATYFPESRYTGTTIVNQQEYQIPETHVIYRVYLNGQLCVEVPGNLSTIEGKQILQNDQTGQGAEVSGSGGPSGGGGLMQPQWVIQTPVNYPFINNYGAPSPQAQGWYPGQRPRYYRRGGYLGFIPAPAAAATVVIDCVRVPAPIILPAQEILVPDNYMDAIVDYVSYRAFYSDKDDTAQQMSAKAFADYDKEIRKLRTWKRQYSLESAQTLPLTQRGAWRYGGHKTGGRW